MIIVAMSIPAYIIKRVLLAIPTILIISVIGFTLMRFDFTIPFTTIEVKNPIDPLAYMRNNPAIRQDAIEKEEKRLGLDKPMTVQYGIWFKQVFQFHPEALAHGNPGGFFTPDLGKTNTNDDVALLIKERAGNTLLLNLCVLIVTWLIAIPLGVYAALRWRSTLDRMLTAFASIGMSFPSFVLALLLAMFAVKTGLLPLGGITSPNHDTMTLFQKVGDIGYHLILPGIVMTVGGLAGLQRQMRGNLLDVLESEYIRTARAKGLPENTVIYKHAVRTAINPLVTMMGYEVSALLSGSVLVETVLGFPGLGQLMYKAAIETDVNLVMASLMMSAILLVLGNLITDILLKLVDPRIEVG